MKRWNKVVVSAAVVLFAAGLAGAQILPAPQSQILLPGNLIPKFVDPLPVAGQISVVNATNPASFPALNTVIPSVYNPGTPGDPAALPPVPAIPPFSPYNIHIREFRAQILPSSGVPAAVPPIPANTPSWVWGYLTDGDVAEVEAGGIRTSFLGPVVVAERGVTAFSTYLNELPLSNSQVQPILPIDMTLDWANPLAIVCGKDPLTGDYTNPACGALPSYTGPQPTATHIHGGEVEPAFDGGPDAWETPIDPATGQGQFRGTGFPGQTYTYPNGQQEGTVWFHDHALGLTRLNVYAGMAGVYPILDPANPPLTTLPQFPQYDIPLIIQDRSFDTTGKIFYNLASNPQPNPTVHPFWIPEFIGDTIVVNGKTWPYLNVEQRQYRFRLLNGSNARFYDLTMSKGLKFLGIATDGGYMLNAVQTPNIIIGPGERYEVVVDFSNLKVGTKVVMKNAARTPFPGGAAPTKGGTDTVMQFIVTGPPAAAVANTNVVAGSPIRSTPLEPIIGGFTPGANITRQLTLNEVIGAGGPLELVVNNSKFNLPLNTPGCSGTAGQCRETELPAIGDTEIWEIINITADAHPMHTHLVTFQILDRTPFKAGQWIRNYDAALLANGVLPGNGPPNTYSVRNADGAIGGNPAIGSFLDLRNRLLPLPYEQGWKDTVITYPGEVTRIVVRWAPQDVPVGGVTVGQNKYPFDPMALVGADPATGFGGVGYVWHCHIIDHEDNEMMRNYTVMPNRQTIW